MAIRRHDQKGKLQKMILREILPELGELDLIDLLAEVWGVKRAYDFAIFCDKAPVGYPLSLDINSGRLKVK